VNGPWDRFKSAAPATASGAAPAAAGPWTKFQSSTAQSDVAIPPPGLTPGSREYADWAASAARAGKKLPQVSPTPPPAGEVPADTGIGGWVSQGLSGFNEGLARGAGSVVDLTAGAMNKGIEGTNALLHTNIPQITHPVGGSEMFASLLAPTIKPESADKGQQMLRRVTQEVGNAVPIGMGFAAKAAEPLKVLGAEITSATTAGAGAAGAQQVAPGNPWAELGAELAGGFTPSSLVNTLRRATASKIAPTIEELLAAKTAAYNAADQAGVKYSPKAFKGLAADMVQSALADNLSPTRHPVATSMLKDIAAQADKGLAPSLTQLDQLRQVVRRDVVTPSYGNPAAAADAHFGKQMIDHIDDFIAKAGPNDVVSGDAGKAGSLILAARELNTRVRKTEIIQDAIAKAKLQAASSGSGGNINNALRTQFKSILNNKSRLRAFNAQEKATMTGLVKQGRFDELLRYVGKFSPGGSGLIGGLELGAAALHPATLAVPAAGYVAKRVADARTIGKAEKLAADVASGGGATSKITATPAQIAAAKAQLLVELQNLQHQQQPTDAAFAH
jgi:hypothetical protein